MRVVIAASQQAARTQPAAAIAQTLSTQQHRNPNNNDNKSFPKVIREQRVVLAQLCNKVPIGYNGTPQIHPKTAASTSTITVPM